ncbi:MAG TPA: type II secretion system minor pseudopilin GspH [Spongiibacteraceae bacterium]|jgi:general secretion pathway protein H|nr:type II secretion system minor pseudopilin GspH [Spongiibacteraceae bacterium]HUH37421.1 type II secretion system minor pseudopilin GspH [Spongiibacteraceae bacterium]
MRRARGFSLLELMLVLVIIAVMAGLVSLAVGGNPHRELEREAERLSRLLEVAGEEAVQRGLQLGFFSDGSSYALRVYAVDDARWEPVQDRRLGRYRLPDNVILEAREQDSDAPRLPATAEELPLMVLMASGEITPFNLVLTHRDLADAEYRISSDGFSGIFVRAVP